MFPVEINPPALSLTFILNELDTPVMSEGPALKELPGLAENAALLDLAGSKKE